MATQTPFFPFRRHALAIALALAINAVNAGTIQVKDDCTLANAITNANTDADKDGADGCIAGSGADTINLKANAVFTFTQIDNNTDGDNALPSVSSVITINGNHATLKRSNALGTPKFRLLHIAQNGNLAINKLNLTGGKAPFAYVYYQNDYLGGAIFTRGILSVNDSLISNNQAGTEGGGIANLAGTVTLSNSHVTGNKAGNGGGVATEYGKITLTATTLSGNKADNGGGIWNRSGAISFAGSTISGNTANNGAGIHNADAPYSFNSGCYGSAALVNSTISGNKGTGIQNQDETATKYFNYYSGGYAYYKQARCYLTSVNSTIANNRGIGIDNRGVLFLRNSLLADNNQDCSNSAAISTTGVNLVENNSCNTQLSGDPRLGPLLDNGGLTSTHALLSGSLAINQAAKIFCPKTDQRDIKRQLAVNQACDIGAYQRLASLPDSIAGLLQFFDNQASINAIVGITPQKREAVRRQLLVAGEYEDRDLTPTACKQLKKTLAHIDPDATPEPDDYVTGTSADGLMQKIIGLRTRWQCK